MWYVVDVVMSLLFGVVCCFLLCVVHPPPTKIPCRPAQGVGSGGAQRSTGAISMGAKEKNGRTDGRTDGRAGGQQHQQQQQQ